MPRPPLEQHRRQLVHLVVEFASGSGPLNSADVEAQFVQHPWFRAPGGPAVIKGISEAPTPWWTVCSSGRTGETDRLAVGFGVASVSIIPNAVWTTAPPDAPPLPAPPAWPLFPQKSPYENDRENVKARLRQLAEGDVEPVRTWVRDAVKEHPDLVSGMLDPDRLDPILWLSGIQGACLLAVRYLLENTDGMLGELRWCESCGPWMPSGAGRPTVRCGCGKLRQRAAVVGRFRRRDC